MTQTCKSQILATTPAISWVEEQSSPNSQKKGRSDSREQQTRPAVMPPLQLLFPALCSAESFTPVVLTRLTSRFLKLAGARVRSSLAGCRHAVVSTGRMRCCLATNDFLMVILHHFRTCLLYSCLQHAHGRLLRENRARFKRSLKCSASTSGQNTSEQTKIRKQTMHHRRRSKSRKRRGIATVECALCLPIFVLITASTIDICSAIFLRESLTLAAYEGSRVGVERGGTDAIVTSRIQNFLDERSIVYDGGSIQISDPGFNTAGTLEHVTVTVTVPCAGNMPLTGGLFVGRNISASITMRKEFVNL